MGIADFPFLPVTVVALCIHVVSGVISTMLRPVWKGDSTLDRWWGPGQMARFFRVKRSEVGSPLAWRFLLVGRGALVIAVVSFALDILIN